LALGSIKKTVETIQIAIDKVSTLWDGLTIQYYLAGTKKVIKVYRYYRMIPDYIKKKRKVYKVYTTYYLYKRQGRSININLFHIFFKVGRQIFRKWFPIKGRRGKGAGKD
jgi:hypothetical protein